MMDHLCRFVSGFAVCFGMIVIIGMIIWAALWVGWQGWLPTPVTLFLAVIFLMACYVVGQLIE